MDREYSETHIWNKAQEVKTGDVIRIWERGKRLPGFVLYSTVSKDGFMMCFKILTVKDIRECNFKINDPMLIANRQTLNGLQSAFG